MASFGSSPIALGIANKIPYKAVFVPYVQGKNIEALVAKSETGAKTVADLKGKEIAAPFGTTSHYALLNALELAGHGAFDVTLLDMGGQDIVAAWTRGDIDAAYIWSPALDECKKDGSILTNDGELAEQGVLIPEIAVAADGFAEKYPTLVSQYVYALINNPEILLEALLLGTRIIVMSKRPGKIVADFPCHFSRSMAEENTDEARYTDEFSKKRKYILQLINGQ